MHQNTNIPEKPDRSWEKIIMKYNRPDIRKSLWQIFNTAIPYLGLWFIMIQALHFSYFLTLLFALPAAGLLIRLFIIFHDCSHGSFFKLRRTNDLIGTIMGILTFTPYAAWQTSHREHHATSGNLDKRGVGDIWTLTVEESASRSKREQFIYRMYRHPLIMFAVGSIYMVFFGNRLTNSKMNRQQRTNVYLTNFGIMVIAVSVSFLIGFRAYVMIQLPVVLIAHFAGIWLFYIQHQFEDVTWERGHQWDYMNAALTGSSFLKLPAVMQWFTGNIGYHHIHHLSSRIPNYNLQRCHQENDIFRRIKPVTLLSSFRALKLRLWDEASRRMITFRQMAL